MRNISILIKRFKENNGLKNLKLYFQNNVLLFFFIQIFLLGTNKKSLELIRISIQQKIYNKLKRKYKYVKEAMNFEVKSKLPSKNSNVVWFCWLQGIEKAPLVVIKCYESIEKNLPEKEIIIITSHNFHNYVQFPDFIINKWEKGIISNTHFSDLLRIELLINHGGTWIDSTVFLSGDNIPQCFFNSELFVFQKLKPGRDGNSIFISSWFMSSYINNKILLTTRFLLYEYWSKKNKMIDYFLLHYFFCLACEWFPNEYKKIPKYSNSIPHILQLEMFDKFNSQRYKEITQMSPIHKISYKSDTQKTKIKNTFYDLLFN